MIKNCLKASTAAVAMAMASVGAEAADGDLVRVMDKGFGIHVGDVSLKVGGSVNGYVTHQTVGVNNATIAGGLVGPANTTTSVRNGLLPGFLTFTLSTKQSGWDVTAHFGMYPGINSNSNTGGANSPGSPSALSTTGIDFRQTYMTFGRPEFGSVKIGRDLGLFAGDAILNDMTLLSVGSTGSNAAPSNTSLGRIGFGYIYADFQPQITYTSPSFSGFTVAAGVFQPLRSSADERQAAPGFQGKISYDGSFDAFSTRLWLSGLTQKHASTLLGGPNYVGQALETGAKVAYGPLTVVGSYYTGDGVGTTGLFLSNISGTGVKRRSNGFYLQGMFTFNKFSTGVSYGESTLNHADAADRTAVPNLVRRNDSWVGQVRYSLTSWVTLIGEYTHARSSAHNGDRATSDTVAVGGFMAF